MNKILFILLSVCFVIDFSDVSAQKNAAARYEIDAKRIGVSPVDKDALPRGREFIRLDSTYYVGWMYEGIYKYDRSSDYLGYKNAIRPLRKAFNLITKDYGKAFKRLFATPQNYMDNQSRLGDLYEIESALQLCYNNIEMPDSSMALLDIIDSYNLQKDFFGTCTERAWLYHRNRFFTSDKFDFLKNSIEENEKMAFRWCYKGFERIQKNQGVNDYWFGPHQSDDDRMMIDHNLAILHAYKQSYDSAEYYYKQLEAGGRISWGNYAELQTEIGNFDLAIQYFDKRQIFREHGLDEKFYYVPTLLVLKGNPKAAIQMENKQITQSGSTPGFGWYSIALARSYLYDGQLDSCEFYLTKAANFKELHIGTTLTQSQYEFTINLLKVQLIDKKTAQLKFVNRGWWYNLKDLYNFVALKIEKYLNAYVVVNQMANNPERKRIVYDLFCNESTVSFDESMCLLKDFSNSYFQNKYNDYQQKDKRLKIQRYFKLFCTKLSFENGDYAEATKAGEKLLGQSIGSNSGDDSNPNIVDTATEKLFLARLYEVLANSYGKQDNTSRQIITTNLFFDQYPQLLPFSDVPLKMHLSTEGVTDEVTTKVMDDIRRCHIQWADAAAADATEVQVQFSKKGKLYEARIHVISPSGKIIVNRQQMVFKDAKGTGAELALRFFGKGGNIEWEPN